MPPGFPPRQKPPPAILPPANHPRGGGTEAMLRRKARTGEDKHPTKEDRDNRPGPRRAHETHVARAEQKKDGQCAVRKIRCSHQRFELPRVQKKHRRNNRPQPCRHTAPRQQPDRKQAGQNEHRRHRVTVPSCVPAADSPQSGHNQHARTLTVRAVLPREEVPKASSIENRHPKSHWSQKKHSQHTAGPAQRGSMP